MKLKRWLGMSRPIIPLLIALMAGISCSNLFQIPDTPIQVCLAAVLLLILLILIKNWCRILYPFLLFSLFLTGYSGDEYLSLPSYLVKTISEIISVLKK